ncbi:MAG: hypothetical protein U0575_10510 [Phycisphaerales bacterium]
MTRMRALAVAGYAALVLVAFWFAWRWGAGRLLGGDDAALKRESAARAVLVDVRERRERKPEQDRQLAEIVNRTLGGSLPAVDSALRARLNRLGESERLRDLAVGTGANTLRDSPAKARYGRDPEQRALRDETDFVEVEGWITGDGTPEQVLRLLQRIDAEPWIKRIAAVRVDAIRGAKPNDPARLRANIRLETIFLPGREPEAQLASTWSIEQAQRLAPLAEASLFSLPKPADKVAAAPPPPPPPPTAPTPPPFPYDEWTLTGVARGPAGVEAWLHNRRSGERRVLASGQALHEMTFADATGESAQFTLGGARVSVTVGAAMSERTPVQ